MLYWRRIVYLNNLFSPTRWVIPSPTPTTKPPANPLLPLRPNRHPERDETPTEWGIIHSSQKEALIVSALPDIT